MYLATYIRLALLSSTANHFARRPTMSSPTRTAAPSLHFVVLHHGHHGGPRDYELLANYMQHAPKDTIVLRPFINNGIATDEGIRPCASRLIEYVVEQVHVALQGRTFSQEEVCPSGEDAAARSCGRGLCKGNSTDVVDISCSKNNCSSSTAGRDVDGSAGKPEVAEDEGNASHFLSSKAQLHFSFVGHSMGGLIIRAALPGLADTLNTHFPQASLHWEVMCTMSTPHLGVAHMPSRTKSMLAGIVGKLFSQGVYEMLLKDQVLVDEMLSDRYLLMWGAFRRRLVLCMANDNTVMGYSAALFVSEYERRVLGYKPGKQAMATTDVAAATQLPQQGNSNGCGGAGDLKSPRQITRLTDISYATSFAELQSNGWELHQVTPDLWPEDLLPRERAMAERILSCVGSLEVHTIDFRPSQALYSGPRTFKVRIGAHSWAHRAIICKDPCNVPEVFGFVSEFVAVSLLDLPSVATGVTYRENVERASLENAEVSMPHLA